MLINYVPGEECRVAIVHDGKLEELHEERANNVSHVGDIYVGKVVNVEPSIQAAFIDFGLDNNGFLHISDLHPRYFSVKDDDRTERVGKKTPRRERPPIQAALKRGQEITVQVLKEGIGTKGPTLTSYLSIPGRYLVMMPDMDKVGVSRKVEDEEQRRKMRQALEQLELPEGFGFILRTAGMDRPKTELKRDLSYLTRLWKDMERRRAKGRKPRLLYAESDLLMRSLRDFLTSEVDEVIIDDESAIRRANRFMKIVAPRSSTKLLHYNEPAPLFHAFRIEEQIATIHAREVPLPSGGSLVIDEAEALIAIDVNSGRMRSHGDAETTAFRTNQEAVEEICRQLRLRDLGGLVINDLIDMRSRSHQRQIENQFRNHLKRDRARSKILSISQFGIVEMTRQRMKGSLRSAHFTGCPECGGRGVVQRPDSVANDAIRNLANLLQHERVTKVEMVVSPRVASELLSTKRLRLGQLESITGKHVDVRVSETIPVDRLTFYAYDDRGSDIDVKSLPTPPVPRKLTTWDEKPGAGEEWSMSPAEEADQVAQQGAVSQPEDDNRLGDSMLMDDLDDDADEAGRSKRKRRSRGRRGGRSRRKSGDDGAAERSEDQRRTDEQTREDDRAPSESASGSRAGGERDEDDSEEGAGRKRRRRRGRRGGRGRRKSTEGDRTEDRGGEQTPSKSRSTSADSDSDSKSDAGADGDRSDSWDLDPSEVKPQESGKSSGGRGRRGRGRGGRGRPRDEDEKTPASGKQADQQPAEDRPRETPPPESESDSGAGSRGDSWDLDPAEVKPTKPRGGGRRKSPSTSNAPDRKRNESAPKPKAKDDAKAPKSTEPKAAGERGDSWDLDPAEVKPARSPKSGSRSKSGADKPGSDRGGSGAAKSDKDDSGSDEPRPEITVRPPEQAVRPRQAPVDKPSKPTKSKKPILPAHAMPDNVHPVSSLASAKAASGNKRAESSDSKKKPTRKKKSAAASKKKTAKKTSAKKSTRKKSTGGSRKKSGSRGGKSGEGDGAAVEAGATSE